MSTATTTKKERYSRKQVLSFPWSDYQRQAIDFVRHGTGHGMVEAVAGSGKTKLLEGIVAATPSSAKVCVLAFNKHIAVELENRIPPSAASISTAHSMGKTLLIRHFGGEVFEPNDRKYQQLAAQALYSLSSTYLEYLALERESREESLRLYPVPPPNVTDESAKGKAFFRALSRYLVNLTHYVQVTLTAPTPAKIKRLIEYYDLDPNDDDGFSSELAHEWLVPLVRDVLERGEQEAVNRNIGLDDLIWLPHQWDLKAPLKDYVLVDEVQDANAALTSLYLRLAGESGRLIVVGDPKQAIYGFSGSTTDAWKGLQSKLSPVRLPLSVCYRCPRSHVALAQLLVPQIQPATEAPEGKVTALNPQAVFETVQPGDLLLCRLTAPLVSLCLKLIAGGRKAKVRGRNLGEQLGTLAKRAVGDATYPSEFLGTLEQYCSKKIAVYQAADEEMRAETLQDQWEALRACFDYFGLECSNLQAFSKRVEDLFCDDNERPPIVLSTIHRAKGDEAARVFILGSNWMPFIKRCKQEWQTEQEWHLTYVALTRCKWIKDQPESGSLYLVPLPRKRGETVRLEDLEHPLGGMALHESPWANTAANDKQPETYIAAHGFKVGDVVHKRYFLGWTGTVTGFLDAFTLEVQWIGDGYSVPVQATELRAENEPYQGYREDLAA